MNERTTGCWTNRATTGAVCLLLILLTSCMVGPNYETPKAKVATQWATNSAISTQPINAADAYWWRNFNDPTLNHLVEIAYSNNLSLQIAGVRVLQARAQLSESIGYLFPQQQGLSGSLNYTRLNSSLIDGLPGFTPNYAVDQLLFGATWEIDFWGKFRRNIQAAGANFGESVASYDDALVTLIADVAKNYVAIRTSEERMRVAITNSITQRESLRIAKVQFEFGETSELDMRQAATICLQTEADVPRMQHIVNQATDALAVLLGETPEEVAKQLTEPGSIPVAPPQVAVGIPRDLLRRRPDVRAAGLAAASQSALIGVAKANMYPAFSLAGAFGFGSNNELNNSLSDIFMWQNRAVQGGASFFFPLFNYGQLVNQVRVQDATFQQAILNYQNTVLVAQKEVADGLSAFYNQQLVLTNLLEAATNAQRATVLSIVEYKAGEDDYTTVLSAEQSQLSVEDAVVNAKGAVVLGLIDVYQALGGGWEIRDGHDVVPAEVKEAMARRTNWGKMLERDRHMPKNSPGP